ncbi:MAG: MBL fold metallo-hydrolase [Actinobacteria bacterium]|nr:MBL fold metallo-hydrolase [Actinomycetota bacterium]
MSEVVYSDDRIEIHAMVVGPLDTNVYVLRCRRSGNAVLVDAADQPDLLLRACRSLGVRSVLQTHGHRDHIQAVPALRAAGYPVAVGAGDAAKLAGYDEILADGQVVDVGELRVRTLATPGHTPGSLCFRVEGSDVVLSGDTLFPGGPGATGGDPVRFATILDGIETKLFTLPPQTVVLPGHGVATTIGTEQPHLAEWAARGW